MTTTLVIAPLLVPLVTAVATLLVRFDDRLQRGVSLFGAIGYLLATLLLFRRIVLRPSEPAVVPYYLSDWPAPYGITIVADALSAFMLLLAGIVGALALVYSIASMDEFAQRLSFHPLYHFALVGVSGAFLTGDVFNLFVWFEVMLMSSYVLVVFYSGPEHTRAALTYVVLNLAGSAVMLVAIGGLYATTGTLNMAHMARRLAAPAASNVAVAPTLGLGALLLAVFALKAGVVPFHFWVPGAYRAAPAPVTALLAGVVKKVGVYAVIRLYFTVFASASYAGITVFDYLGPVVFIMAAASILFGGIAAIGTEDLEGLLAYSSISQVGFILLPLAVGATATAPGLRALAVTAALVYSFNHGVAKALLFLAAGLIETVVGTTRLASLGGLAERAPLLAGSFLLGGLSLVGIPPLLGFFGKLYAFRVAAEAYAVDSVGAGVAVWILLLGAILTIAYITRAWNAVFWGDPSEAVETTLPERWPRPESGRGTTEEDTAAADGGQGMRLRPQRRSAVTQTVIVVALAVSLVAFGIGIEAIADGAIAGAEAATDTGRYVEAVLQGGDA